jgi:hypothetical protein
MRAHHVILAAAFAALGACGQQAAAPKQDEKGLYGASSGPNPNLADLQNDRRTPSEALAGAPAPEAESGQSAAPAPDAEGGQSAATTEGSGQDQSADAHAEHRQGTLSGGGG